MFCKNCGSQIDDNAVACPHCGVATDNFYTNRSFYTNRNIAPAYDDAPSGGFAVLCFFVPVVGLILYILWHDTMPLRAKSCGKGAIAGVIVEIVLAVLIVVLAVVFSYLEYDYMGPPYYY